MSILAPDGEVCPSDSVVFRGGFDALSAFLIAFTGNRPELQGKMLVWPYSVDGWSGRASVLRGYNGTWIFYSICPALRLAVQSFEEKFE